MLSYCLKCKKKQKKPENINPSISKTIHGKTMILSTYAIYNTKKSRSIKKQEASGILSNFGFKTPLSTIPLLDDIFFLNAIPLSATPLNAIPLKKDKRIMYKK